MDDIKDVTKQLCTTALAVARRGEAESSADLLTVLGSDDLTPGDSSLQKVVDKVPVQQRALSALKEHLTDAEKLYKTLGQIIKAERSFIESKAHEMASGVGEKTFFDFSESGWAFGGAAMFAQQLSEVMKGLDQPKLAESIAKAFGPVRPMPIGIENETTAAVAAAEDYQVGQMVSVNGFKTKITSVSSDGVFLAMYPNAAISPEALDLLKKRPKHQIKPGTAVEKIPGAPLFKTSHTKGRVTEVEPGSNDVRVLWEDSGTSVKYPAQWLTVTTVSAAADKLWVCPKCKGKNVAADHLKWRTCPDCGWEEKHPTDLKEASAAPRNAADEFAKIMQKRRAKLGLTKK